VFHPGTYAVRVGDPDRAMHEVRGLVASPENESRLVIEIE